MNRFTINTQRLSLRQLTPDDAAFLVELMNEPPYLENIGDRGVRSVADSIRYIDEKYAPGYVRDGYGMYLAELPNGAVPIGICGLVKRSWLDQPDLGFAFLSRFWSNGYATEEAEATLSHAKEALKLLYLYGVVSPKNTRSISLLERVGFRHQPSLTFPGQPPGTLLYRAALRPMS